MSASFWARLHPFGCLSAAECLVAGTELLAVYELNRQALCRISADLTGLMMRHALMILEMWCQPSRVSASVLIRVHSWFQNSS
jgi:hypothetical protein